MDLGYHDINKLKALLEAILTATEEAMSTAADSLKDYNLAISRETRLHEAQNQISTSTPPNHVSFLEYQTVGNLKHRAASYVRSEYEKSIRNPGGTNAMDVYNIASIINEEAKNISTFLNIYIGDINDTSEYRTIELFQDWAEEALKHTGALGYFLAQRDKKRNQLGKYEVDQLNSETAKQYQAVFQAKLNVINQQFDIAYTGFKKDFSFLSNVFYTKVLGPALQFRTKIMKDVEPKNASDISKTTLGQEILSATASLNANMAGALGDVLRRNQNYQERADKLFGLMQARSAYINYIEQLGGPGQTVSSNFLASNVVASVSEEDFSSPIDNTLPYRSSHALLDGVEEPDAHSQYILRDGGSVLSDLYVEDGVKIDGMSISKHSHKGIDIDGSEQISGADIEPGSIYSELMSSVNTSPEPSELAIADQRTRIRQGVVAVDTTFNWDQSPNERFELQIVPYSPGTGIEPYAFDYIEHNYAIYHLSTEDSNFMSFRDVGSGNVTVLDASGSIRVHEISEERVFESATPSDNENLLPFSEDGLVLYPGAIEVGNELFYINPLNGIYVAPLLENRSELIHQNQLFISGDLRQYRQSLALTYNPLDKHLYWFDVLYSFDDDSDQFINSYSLQLMCYDTQLRKAKLIRTVTGIDKGLVNEDFIFLPIYGSYILNNHMYLCVRNGTVNREINGVSFEDLNTSMLRVDIGSGSIVELEGFSSVENNLLYSMFKVDDDLYAQAKDVLMLDYVDDQSINPSDANRAVVKFVLDGDSVSFEPRYLSNIGSGDSLVAVTADDYGNIYHNVRRENSFLIQRATVNGI